MFIGFAKDIHKLIPNVTNKPLVLGNYHIQNAQYSINAVSDGDLILHSIVSALLGAMGLKTLGEYFSDQDSLNKQRSSMDFLAFAIEQLNDKKLFIESLDLCIICEQIMLYKHLPFIREQLLKILPLKTLGIKCTRFEDPQNNYIECYCNLILSRQ